jgi:hypothetical protein
LLDEVFRVRSCCIDALLSATPKFRAAGSHLSADSIATKLLCLESLRRSDFQGRGGVQGRACDEVVDVNEIELLKTRFSAT